MVTCVIGEVAGSFKGPSTRSMPRISSSQASFRKRWSARALVSPRSRERSAGIGGVGPGLFGPDVGRPFEGVGRFGSDGRSPCEDVGRFGSDGLLGNVLGLLDDDDDDSPCDGVGLFGDDVLGVPCCGPGGGRFWLRLLLLFCLRPRSIILLSVGSQMFEL